MLKQGKQINILFHAFMGRIFDFELLSTGSEPQNLLITIAALLGAFNFAVAFIIVPRYGLSTQSQSVLSVNAWQDEEFLIATTLAIAAFLMVLSWETLIPDRRDCIALGVLPVRSRTLLLAKVAAIGCAVTAAVGVVNIFTSLCYPLILQANGGGAFGLLRTFCAYWATMLAGGLFVACAVLSIQGILNQMLPYWLFLRVSGLLQLSCFFLVLIVYFLKPPLATPSNLLAADHNHWLLWMPSYWFLGLFHKLNGSAPGQALDWLASRAVWGLLASLCGAALGYALGYARTMRRIIEQPDILPDERTRRFTKVLRWLGTRLLNSSLERAVVLFTTRTLARSRQHRLLVAFYSGIGLAAALAYSDSVKNWKERYNTNASFIIASVVLMLFVVLSVRVAFTFPFTLSANWIFRITAVRRPSEYLDAVRTSLYLLTAFPIWITCAVFFFTMWPNLPALGHMAALLIMGILMVERSLAGFRKIPFACSYFPGKANLKVTLALWGCVILFLTHFLGEIEAFALHRLARFAVLSSILLVATVAAYRRRSEFVNAPHNSLQFDDVPPGAVFVLDLAADRDLTNDDEYVEAHLPTRLRSRIRTVALTMTVLAFCGWIYERVGEWRDRGLTPQIGHSVDVGRRAMNIYCSGEGSPAVIFESNWGSPGYSWVPIQREIAKFTKACWYDRAGYGWSDEGPFPNHSDSIARDLHRLLTKAHVQPPYILAAHAMGTFHARVYRGFYPDEVVGLVLIDPMNEDMTINIHNHVEALRPTMLFIRRILGNLGFERLMFPGWGTQPAAYSEQEWKTLQILRRQLKSRIAEGKEPPMWINGELARNSGGFGGIPVVVLSAGIQDQEEDPKLDHDHPLKMELHQKLASLSTRGVQVVVDSGHNIPAEAPAAVVRSVRDTVAQVRESRPAAVRDPHKTAHSPLGSRSCQIPRACKYRLVAEGDEPHAPDLTIHTLPTGCGTKL